MLTARQFPFAVALILSVLAVALGFAWGANPVEQWGMAARYTARVGFPIFLLTYVASSLVRLWPSGLTKTILRHRRQWGLAFALTHSIHLGALVMAHVAVGRWPEPATIAGGGLAYVLLYAMAFTSSNAAMRAMGRNWKRLHTLGIHWLWFIFAFSYFGRIMDPARMAEGVLFFGLCVMALGLRVVARQKGRSPYPSL
jgi:methionine sulfoxide reductase heme-binding subunit